jgi:hypothetical protein
MANAFGITELTDSQSSIYATVNRQLHYIPAFLTGARDIASAPPGSPVENAMYIIGARGNTGAWSSFSVKDLVFYLGGAWYKLAPVEGMTVWVWDENMDYVYNGTNWLAKTGIALVSASSSASPSA